MSAGTLCVAEGHVCQLGLMLHVRSQSGTPALVLICRGALVLAVKHRPALGAVEGDISEGVTQRTGCATDPDINPLRH